MSDRYGGEQSACEQKISVGHVDPSGSVPFPVTEKVHLVLEGDEMFIAD